MCANKCMRDICMYACIYICMKTCMCVRVSMMHVCKSVTVLREERRVACVPTADWPWGRRPPWRIAPDTGGGWDVQARGGPPAL